MERYKIERINAYARRVKAGETLTEAELADRDALRREYIAGVVGNLRSQLDHTWVVDEKGVRRKLRGKEG